MKVMKGAALAHPRTPTLRCLIVRSLQEAKQSTTAASVSQERTLREVVEVLPHDEDVVALAAARRVQYAALHARAEAAKRLPLRVHAVVRDLHDPLRVT